jgi:hypothetical protein
MTVLYVFAMFLLFASFTVLAKAVYELYGGKLNYFFYKLMKYSTLLWVGIEFLNFVNNI